MILPIASHYAKIYEGDNGGKDIILLCKELLLWYRRADKHSACWKEGRGDKLELDQVWGKPREARDHFWLQSKVRLPEDVANTGKS